MAMSLGHGRINKSYCGTHLALVCYAIVTKDRTGGYYHRNYLLSEVRSMGTLIVKCRSCGGTIPVLINVPSGAHLAPGAPEVTRVTVKCPHCKIPGSYPFTEVAYQAEAVAVA